MGSAGRIHHIENVKFYMSHLQQYTKIIKRPYLATLF
jgi:DNA-binding CsgD family transcriptional regulator